MSNPEEEPPSSTTTLNTTVRNVCRFCLGTDRHIHQIHYSQWSSSEVAKLYREVTGAVLVELSDGLAEGFCDACLDRLRFSSESLRMFKEAELFWSDIVSSSTADEDVQLKSGQLTAVEDDAESVSFFEDPNEVGEDCPERIPENYECFVCHEAFNSM